MTVTVTTRDNFTQAYKFTYQGLMHRTFVLVSANDRRRWTRSMEITRKRRENANFNEFYFIRHRSDTECSVRKWCRNVHSLKSRSSHLSNDNPVEPCGGRAL